MEGVTETEIWHKGSLRIDDDALMSNTRIAST